MTDPVQQAHAVVAIAKADLVQAKVAVGGLQQFFAEKWAEVRKWWSMWVSATLAMLIALIPTAADQWPTLFSTIAPYFPKGTGLFGPLIGVGLTMLARIVSQDAVMAKIKALFGAA